MSSRKRQLAGDIREYMDEDVLRAIRQRPRWQTDVEGEQEQLGWQPKQPGLISDLEQGHYLAS